MSPQIPATASDKQLIPGLPSEAQISPNSNEVILKYNPKNPIITHLNSIQLPVEGKVTTIRALDSRNLAVGTKEGTLMIVDIEHGDGKISS